MRGIDNASYYRLMPDDKRFYINDSGTGNTLDLSHPCALQMVTDSLAVLGERDARRRFPLSTWQPSLAAIAMVSTSATVSSWPAARTRYCAR